MRSSKYAFILTAACAAALTACGGGGSGSDPATSATSASDTSTPIEAATPTTPTTPAEFNVAEYVGTWAGDASVCMSDFPYGNYFYRLTALVFAEKSAEATHTAYNDAACTSKAGRVIESYDVSWSAGSVTGKTNVARAKLTSTGSSTGADGGTGMQLNKLPNGSAIGSGGKLLLDVDGTKLFGSVDSPLDADGFRTALNPNSFATKQ